MLATFPESKRYKNTGTRITQQAVAGNVRTVSLDMDKRKQLMTTRSARTESIS
jgi:hypothetical protein